MRWMKRLALVAVPTVLLALGLTLVAFAAPAYGKTDLCHLAGDKYVKISVSDNAVDTHLAHGDVLPDAYAQCP